jgi:hypothetical protein
MDRAITNSSDYTLVKAAQGAIDRYFDERKPALQGQSQKCREENLGTRAKQRGVFGEQ